MFANCFKFNGQDSPYYQHGYRLHESFNKLVKTHFPDTDLSTDLSHIPKPLSANSASKRKMSF